MNDKAKAHLNHPGTLAKMLQEARKHQYSTEQVVSRLAEAIVRRAAEVARNTVAPEYTDYELSWADDCAEAILNDAGLK